MSNMVAQAPDNNQGPWAAFEDYLRTLARPGRRALHRRRSRRRRRHGQQRRRDDDARRRPRHRSGVDLEGGAGAAQGRRRRHLARQLLDANDRRHHAEHAGHQERSVGELPDDRRCGRDPDRLRLLLESAGADPAMRRGRHERQQPAARHGRTTACRTAPTTVRRRPTRIRPTATTTASATPATTTLRHRVVRFTRRRVAREQHHARLHGHGCRQGIGQPARRVVLPVHISRRRHRRWQREHRQPHRLRREGQLHVGGPDSRQQDRPQSAARSS